MAACKRQRKNACTPLAVELSLPLKLLLEIIARSDAHTLFRAAAACKLLRRDILSPPFIRRVTQPGGIVPPSILTYLNTHDDQADPPPPLSLVHPATPVAMSFLDDHLNPYMSRFLDDLVSEHCPVSSRGGLVLLRRRHFSGTLSNLCVYDPITGHRTFLSYPLGINSKNTGCFDGCLLLTAADGIDCSFLLFFIRRVILPNKSNARTVKVHIATSRRGTWARASMSDSISYLLLQRWFALHKDVVVLHGGVIHWLVRHYGMIVTYNVCTMEGGTINLPGHAINFKEKLHLGSYDGRQLLCVLGAKGFSISVWHQLPSRDWPPEAMTIDTEEKLQSLYPDISLDGPFLTVLQCADKGISTVFLRIYRYGLRTSCRVLLFNVELETLEVLVQQNSTHYSILLEVDLPSRLRTMKIFSKPNSSTS
ncbi:unnamed protein product [Alopecurus aequalis]